MTILAILAVMLAGGALGAWALMVRMPGPPAGRAATVDVSAAAARLQGHVRTLGGEIGQRNIWHPDGLAAAAAYVESELADLGYAVRSQRFEARGVPVRNLIATLPGRTAEAPAVIVGAHYDTVRGSPGADDNASGVAAMLELARRFAGRSGERSLQFVAFVNEEAPFFREQSMGSQRHAAAAAARGEVVEAMYSLEMLGYYDERPGSQRYPFPFSLFYPDTADFIAFVGNLDSRRLVRRSIGAFRAHAGIPSHGVAAPEQVPGVGWSDHASYWAHGYPAVMVTDTSFYRYPHYHQGTDTPDRLDYARMARVVDGLQGMLGELAAVP